MTAVGWNSHSRDLRMCISPSDEELPDGTAQKPSDVVDSPFSQTFSSIGEPKGSCSRGEGDGNPQSDSCEQAQHAFGCGPKRLYLKV